MRTVVSALLALLFVVVTTADTFACPDGCTDEVPLAAPHAVSLCAFCHGWNQAPAAETSRPASRVLPWQPADTTSPTDPEFATVEPPPKAT